MSFVGSMFSGSNGAGFQAGAAPIAQPTTDQQATSAYNTSQQGLQSQQALLTALAAQNGLSNQNQVYGQLQGVANGTGPNPAQTQLNQSTAQNIAQQGAMMGSQRGTGQNVGLMTRQIAQQGANTQQQAAGQAATLEAQQRLSALSAAGQMANTQAANQVGATNAYSQAAQGEQGQILNAIQGQNNSNVAMQNNMNSTNASIAAGNASSQSGMFGSGLNALGGVGSSLLQGKNNGNPTSPSNGVAGNAMPTSADSSNGLGSTDGGMNYGNVAYRGGMIKQKMADGGQVGNPNAPSSSFGQSLSNEPTNNFAASNQMVQQTEAPSTVAAKTGGGGGGILGGLGGMPSMGGMGTVSGSAIPGILGLFGKGISAISGGGDIKPSPAIAPGGNSPSGTSSAPGAAHGGQIGKQVPVMVSPGERYLPPAEVQQVKAGAKAPMQAGVEIPGKAKVDGAKDDLRNDTVPAKLEEGGIVLPRSVTQSKHPAWAAHKFVAEYMAKGGMIGKPSKKAKK